MQLPICFSISISGAVLLPSKHAISGAGWKSSPEVRSIGPHCRRERVAAPLQLRGDPFLQYFVDDFALPTRVYC